ncbi:cadherin-like beta sandwich domain-containing protein [Candidatus Pacearchaeota archaeon]|jgi:hypothetical protein|nr:cadherin-like beta sandwich domain-containing protein [Candidatus Pacearchaeota archaeon]
MSDAISGFGAVLSWNGQPVAEILEIGGLKVASEFKDTTNLSSASRFREKVATVLKAENISFKANFIAGDTDGQAAMIADCIAQTKRTLLITFPDDITFTWSTQAYIGDFEILGLSVDGTMEFSGNIEPTGVPTISNGASTGLSALAGIEENTGAALDLIPNFAIGTYLYTVAVNTASDFVKLTPTGASHTITILNGFDASEVTVATGAQSGELPLGAANTVTLFTITAQETGKVAKVYKVYVTRAAA